MESEELDSNQDLVKSISGDTKAEEEDDEENTKISETIMYEVGNSVEIREGYIGVRHCFRDLNQFFANRLNFVISQLKDNTINSGGPSLLSTPSSSVNLNGNLKRPAPKSSSVKKLVFHRSKRIASDNQNNNKENNTLSARTRAKKLFLTDSCKKLKDEPEPELCFASNQSESNNKNCQNEVPFFSQESSLAGPTAKVVEVNQHNTARSTRSQTKLKMVTNSANKNNQSPVSKQNKRSKAKITTSSTKSTDSLIKHSTNENKPAIDPNVLEPISVSGSAPVLLQNTPSSHQRKKLQESKKQILIMSQEKAKKAIKNREAILSGKQNVLRNRQAERERKMELFKQKQLEKEKQAREKLVQKICAHAPTVPADLPVQPSNSKTASTRSANRKKHSKQSSSSAKVKNSTNLLKSASKELVQNPKPSPSLKKVVDVPCFQNDNPGEPMDICEAVSNHKNVDHFSSIKLSPIRNVENQQLGVPLGVLTNPSSMSQITDLSVVSHPLSSTVCVPNNPNGTIVAQTPLFPPKNNNNGTFVCPPISATSPIASNETFIANNNNKNLSKFQQEMSVSLNSYQITPPRRMASVSTYDISALIDSDDENQHRHNPQEKPIPHWAKGKPFLNAIKEQFSKPPNLIKQQIKLIFDRPFVLPVPVEEMGLTVLERYATRSSSINWDKFNLSVVADHN